MMLEKRPKRGLEPPEEGPTARQLYERPIEISEGALRRYLLGAYPPGFAEGIDRKILAEGAGPILNVIEDELIEEYVTGDMSDADRLLFEGRFLFNDERLEKIRLCSMLLGRPDFAQGLTERVATLRWERATDKTSRRTLRVPTTEQFLSFHSFDSTYIERLRAGDLRTCEHFRAYFTALIDVKLRALLPREAIEDVRQETFARFYGFLRELKIDHPEALGPFVDHICNGVLLEHRRAAAPHDFLDGGGQNQASAMGRIWLTSSPPKETEDRIREILEQLPERDQRLVREVFLYGEDKDKVCADLGVDRGYLRALLRRVKRSFRSLYSELRKRNQGDPSGA